MLFSYGLTLRRQQQVNRPHRQHRNGANKRLDKKRHSHANAHYLGSCPSSVFTERSSQKFEWATVQAANSSPSSTDNMNTQTLMSKRGAKNSNRWMDLRWFFVKDAVHQRCIAKISIVMDRSGRTSLPIRREPSDDLRSEAQDGLPRNSQQPSQAPPNPTYGAYGEAEPKPGYWAKRAGSCPWPRGVNAIVPLYLKRDSMMKKSDPPTFRPSLYCSQLSILAS